jgi:glucosamine-phosphate N-acetyltransferase
LATIREIEYDDIDKGFLEVLDNLLSPNIDHKQAKDILKEIKSNPLHKIFIAKDDTTDKIVGTATLLVEPKFINKGMKVGYIEDVSVKKEYEGTGIGRQIVEHATKEARTVQNCAKVLLYCSDKNEKFYEKLGYKIANDTSVMIHEF